MIFFYGPRGPRSREIPIIIIQTVTVREVEEMEKEPLVFRDEASADDRPLWLIEATDEHARNFDAADPITAEEVIWMWREFESSDMRFSDEFLRRTA